MIYRAIAVLFILALLAGAAWADEDGAHESHPSLGEQLPLWSVIPFIGILLSIALFPLFKPEFWHHHFGKVSAFWALLFAVPFLLAYGHEALHEILHIYLADYIPFIILLWALFTAAGGILIEGTLEGKPAANLSILILGTLIASWIGTTGASMLLIRPLLRANAARKHKVHLVVFFIFLVSNIGGSLTPLGDPPLFLGFLHSVPFFWTFNLLREMLFVSGLLLLLFFLIDSYFYRSEGIRGRSVESGDRVGLRVRGLHNLLFLGGIIGGVLMSGLLHLGHFDLFGIHLGWANILRDFILVLMGLLSLKTTHSEIRSKNEFTWFPIKEVAYLFAGIFMCIIPALALLRAGSAGALSFIIEAVRQPWHYFWITGSLSSFLDNAPTYLTFLNTALGNFFAGLPENAAVGRLIAEQGIYLKAISLGAVLMGANTYIGNAPNFMVRSIAEERGVIMPSFFGYMIWSILILLPIFTLVTVIFF